MLANIASKISCASLNIIYISNLLKEFYLMEWFSFYYLKRRNSLHLLISQKATFKYLIFRNQKSNLVKS